MGQNRSCLLDAANSLHPNLQFTLEKTNSEGNLPFLDLNINVSQDRRVTCSWYQKPGYMSVFRQPRIHTGQYLDKYCFNQSESRQRRN